MFTQKSQPTSSAPPLVRRNVLNLCTCFLLDGPELKNYQLDISSCKSDRMLPNVALMILC